MYGMVSSPGLVLFLSDFRALLVSSLVMVLKYSSDAVLGGTAWSEMLFHRFSPLVDFRFVLTVEVDFRVSSVDLGQLAGKGVGIHLL